MPDPDPSTNVVFEMDGSKSRSDDDWYNTLRPVEYKVLRMKGTEPAGQTVANGGFDDHTEKGTYICAGCSTPLYTSEHKFDCGCGWPGFWTNIKGAVYEKLDKDGFRCEIMCSACGSHLGHVFRGEGFNNPPPNERHCVNSVSIAFLPEGEEDESKVQRCTYNGQVYGA
eukprot:CAMPEP_0113935096 /NCGR_PEP_ID=MMETSP1339-20121228/2318_1 /TAXON_ID=94617 /ORGANISM="Fibrocapsa japonica" /LENGTH=168 /DNA_ID=CAMNT_0000937131 /DNA_START=272 /DNA_END=778 /DNA_ORIENTATION=+ /assembly_acc=CAM_ASM_000762